MSEWIAGYSAALADARKLLQQRGSWFPEHFHDVFDRLMSDLEGDAKIIRHELLSRKQRLALAANSRPARASLD